MEEVSTIGLDIAKSVFQAHGADATGRQLFSQRITRAKVLQFDLPPSEWSKISVILHYGGVWKWARGTTGGDHRQAA